MRKKRKSGRGAKSCAGATPSKGRFKGGGFNAQLLKKLKQKIHPENFKNYSLSAKD